MVYTKVRGWALGRSLQVKNVFEYPSSGSRTADVNLNFLISDMDHINQTSVVNVYVAFVMNSNE